MSVEYDITCDKIGKNNNLEIVSQHREFENKLKLFGRNKNS